MHSSKHAALDKLSQEHPGLDARRKLIGVAAAHHIGADELVQAILGWPGRAADARALEAAKKRLSPELLAAVAAIKDWPAAEGETAPR